MITGRWTECAFCARSGESGGYRNGEDVLNCAGGGKDWGVDVGRGTY